MVIYWILQLILGVLAGSAEEWQSRTIYQLITDRFSRGNGDNSPCQDLSKYCGGTFKGITQNLDYIQGMGFDAIWISPILPNTPDSYHGYAATDFYGVNPHFGTEADLVELITECHSRKMWVMFDVVANHVGPVTNYSEINPFNLTSYYHPYCQINNWQNQTEVEWCWLFTLPDLAQENPYVRQTLLGWINWLVEKYDVDGLRVDTAVEVPKFFWTEFSMYSGVYTMGEIFNGDSNYVAGYQGPLSGTLNYPLFFKLRSWFQDNEDLYSVRSFASAQKVFSNQNYLGNFVDNHDNARFLYQHPNLNRFKNALAWSFTYTGMSIMYYGDEQAFSGGNDPNNREVLWTNMDPTSDLYKFVATIVNFRKEMKVWQYPLIERYADHHFYSYSRGQALMAFSNTDDTVQRYVAYHPDYEGQTVCNVLFTGDCVVVDSQGVPVTLVQGEVKLYKPSSTTLIDQ